MKLMQQNYQPSKELLLLLTASTLGCERNVGCSLDISWDQIDWLKLLRLANFHGLSCWLTEYAKDVVNIPPKIEQKLADSRRRQVLSLTFVEQQKCKLIACLQQHDIRFAILKGGAIAKPLYQQRWYYRAMVDMDILIDPEQLELAFKHIKALGYRDASPSPLSSREFEQISLHHKDSTVIEHSLLHENGHLTLDIHWKLRRNHLLPIEYRDLYDGIAMDGDGVPRLIPALEFIYLCVNGMNDGWRKLKGLADVLYYAQNIDDWTEINETAKGLGVLHIINTTLAICDFFYTTEFAPKTLNKKELLLFNCVVKNFAFNNERPIVNGYLDCDSFYLSVKNSFLWWLAISSELISVTAVLKGLLLPNEDDYKGEIVVSHRHFCVYLIKRVLRLFKKYYLVSR